MAKKKLKKMVKALTGSKFSKLNCLSFGFATGKILALVVFVMTIGGMYGVLGGFPLWNALFFDMYGAIGFRLSWMGAILGAIYAFIDGFVLGWLFAKIYNWKL